MLYFAAVRYKPDYASVTWDPITITDSNKLEGIERKICSLLLQQIFHNIQNNCDSLLR
jgi:hypothetical protein